MSRTPSKFIEHLASDDRQFLENTWRSHDVHIVRCRAHAILLSNQGYAVSEIQNVFQISKPTALAWLNRWLDHGRAGLEDEDRPGGPPILDENEQEILAEQLERFPRQPKRVLQAIHEKTGKTISERTVRRWARRLGLRWKRMRRSLRKRRDEQAFRLAQEEIEEISSWTDLQVAFFDEAAFSLQGVSPYAWQRVGERLEVPVGDRGSIQVLGIQEHEGTTYGYLHQGTVRGTTVDDVLEDYCNRIEKPTVLILDNASVHTCELIVAKLEYWNERGLHFYYLPPYSPELNAIERLWKQLKYQLLPIGAWEKSSSLLHSLATTFRSIGEAIAMPSIQNAFG